jgi:hypothetical protein
MDIRFLPQILEVLLHAPVAGSRRTAFSVVMPEFRVNGKSHPRSVRRFEAYLQCYDIIHGGNGKKEGTQEVCYWITSLLASSQQLWNEYIAEI